MSKKSIFLFLAVLSVSFVLMTYQTRKGHFFAGQIFDLILNGSYAFTRSVADSVSAPFKKISLRDEENKLLRKQVDDLLLERTKSQEAVLENKRLKELLDLRDSRQEYIASAKVLSRGIDRWAHTFVLGKGHKDGVSKDMTAITPKGFAGKIFNVTGSYSKLLLLTDISFSAAVRLQESRKEGVVSGTGTRKVVLKYIPIEEEVKPGDIVITSGLDQLFPPGIPVGFISKIEKQGSGHFQYMEVTPYVDESTIEEVLIIK